jgi:hypothetical protein
VKTILSCLAMLVLLALASGAQAAGVLDFDIMTTGLQGSSISYAGGANPLVGSDLTVLGVTGGNGAPSNDGAMLSITNGLLSFTTGNLVSFNGTTWDFGGGGTVTITGTIPSQTPTGGSYSSFGGVTGTLLSATFYGASVTSVMGQSYQTLGLFFDPPNSALASYFGLPANDYSGFFGLTFTGTTGPVGSDGAFQTSDDFVGSGDTSTTPVPAPGFLVLLCSGGTVSLASYVLRRRKHASAPASAV